MDLQPTRVDESDFRGSRGRRPVARRLWAAASKVTSFPRKRESNSPGAEVDPRFRGGDECRDFHHYGWAARPMYTRSDSLEGFFRSL
jgi:hypothetical protein